MNEHLGPLDEFITANTNLVHYVAKRFAVAAKALGLEYEDIVQEGHIGLIKAYNRFEPSKGYQMSTFAVPYIWGYIRKTINDCGAVDAPRAVREIAYQIYKLGLDDHSAAEVAERLGCTASQAKNALEYLQTRVLSADYPIQTGQADVFLKDLLPTHDDQTGILVDEFLSKLTVKQANVLRLRMQGKRQVDIARFIGTSQSQVGRYMMQIGKKYLKVM